MATSLQDLIKRARESKLSQAIGKVTNQASQNRNNFNSALSDVGRGVSTVGQSAYNTASKGLRAVGEGFGTVVRAPIDMAFNKVNNATDERLANTLRSQQQRLIASGNQEAARNRAQLIGEAGQRQADRQISFGQNTRDVRNRTLMGSGQVALSALGVGAGAPALLGTAAIGGGLGYGITKLMGGTNQQTLEALGSGIGNAPQYAGINKLTQPGVDKLLGYVKPNVMKVIDPLARAGYTATSAFVNGLANLLEDEGLTRVNEGRKSTTGERLTSFGTGAVLGTATSTLQLRGLLKQLKDNKATIAADGFIRNKTGQLYDPGTGRWVKETTSKAIEGIKTKQKQLVEFVGGNKYDPNDYALQSRPDGSGMDLLPKAKSRLRVNPQAGFFAGEAALGWKNANNKFSSTLDKKTRFEIDDSGAKLTKAASERNFYYPDVKKGTLDEYIEHPKLFEQYPDLKNAKVSFVRTSDVMGDGSRAAYDPKTNHITVNTDWMNQAKNEEVKSTLLHEIQHAIQKVEGFARGGSPEMFRNQELQDGQAIDSFNKQMEEVSKQIDFVKKNYGSPDEITRLKNRYETLIEERSKVVDRFIKSQGKYGISGEGNYQRLSGELEARAVQRRMDMPQSQRSTVDPYSAEAIATTGTTNLDDFITRFEGGVQASQPTKGVEVPPINRTQLTGKQLDVPSSRLNNPIPVTQKQLLSIRTTTPELLQTKLPDDLYRPSSTNFSQYSISIPQGQKLRIVGTEPQLKTRLPAQEMSYLSPSQKSAQQVKANIEQSKVSTFGNSIPPQAVDTLKKASREVDSKVNMLDYLRTPDRVLKKIGLENEATLVKDQYNKYLDELPKELGKVTGWYDRVKNNKGSEQRIFRYLDGQKQQLQGEELKVASEMKQYLSDWADRLGLPQEGRIANYITHIFEKDLIEKEFDPELAKIIADRIPGSVYDPFLEKRLGTLGYKENVFDALDAYVKRATRKSNMDVALEALQAKENTLDMASWNYVKSYTDRINLRPTQMDELVDNFIKQSPVGYKLGQRPVASISRTARQMVYRGTLGLNVGSAIRNLTQGVNTYAQLGEKYTATGIMKAARAMATGDAELESVGVLRNSAIEDRSLNATKKMWEKLDKGLFYLFEGVEKFNRGTAYYGAKARALSQGKTEKEAIQVGIDMARKTQFTFGSVDTPVALQSDLVKLATQFQSFNVKQTEFLTEMAKNKEFAGMARWVAANAVILFTVGQAMGWDWKDFVPFGNVTEGKSPIGNTPTFKLATDVGKMALGATDEYGNKIGVSDIGKDLIPFIPAGSQAKKTIEGIQAGNRGYSQSSSGRVRFPIAQDTPNRIKTAVLGQYASKEARDYFNKDRKVLGEKQSAQFKESSDPQSFYQNIMDKRDGKVPVSQKKLSVNIPTDQKTFNDLYKKALSGGQGFLEEKQMIELDPTLDDVKKQEKLAELQTKKVAWSELLIKMQDKHPEKVRDAGIDTYRSGGGATVEERANWVKSQLDAFGGTPEERQQFVNDLWDEKVLTHGDKGTYSALKEMGLDLSNYTGSNKKLGSGKIRARKGSSKKSNTALKNATNDYFENLKKINIGSGKIRATSGTQKINVKGLTFSGK